MTAIFIFQTSFRSPPMDEFHSQVYDLTCFIVNKLEQSTRDSAIKHKSLQVFLFKKHTRPRVK